MSWNAEGLRTKIRELGSWLPAVKADVVAVQEAQFSKTAPNIPGYQPPVVVRRARGRTTGAAVVKGGDVALYIRAGLHFTVLTDSYLAATDDSTELCGVRLLGLHPINIINIYRPPIRATGDDREDRFDPSLLPSDDETIIVGDINGHHPWWDDSCQEADSVGDRVVDWLEAAGWTPLNNGSPTFASYRTGGQSAPDIAACSRSLAQRARWSLGQDLGSDHLPMVVEVRSASAQPRRIRKTRWSFRKADWAQFQADCEAALADTLEDPVSVQRMADRFEEALRSAAERHIPRGARADPRPWALDPELVEAVEERRAARAALREDDPATREQWIAAKRRAAEVERRATQDHFKDFVTSTLSKPANLGRVHKTLKKWERARTTRCETARPWRSEGASSARTAPRLRRSHASTRACLARCGSRGWTASLATRWRTRPCAPARSAKAGAAGPVPSSRWTTW